MRATAFLASISLASCQDLPRAASPKQTVQCQPAPTAAVADTGTALVSQAYGTVASPIPTNAVLFTHEGLAQMVSVQALFAERASTGNVQVQVRLISCSDRPLVLRARTSFLQASTAPAEAPSAWQYVHLPARATALYQERSIAGEAVARYLVELAPESP